MSEHLTDEERAALTVAVHHERGDCTEDPCTRGLVATVERIVADRVERALREAAEGARWSNLGHEAGGHTSTYSVRRWLHGLADQVKAAR